MKRFVKMIVDMGGGNDLKNQKKSNSYFSRFSDLIKKTKKDNVIATLCICCSVLAVVCCCYSDEKQPVDYLGFSQYFDIQTENEDKSLYSTLGFDPRGEALLTENYVVRTTIDSYLEVAKRTFEKYKMFAKENSDIVETKMEGSKFIHKRYITTYPHEWTPNMVKDAILFDLNLSLKLRKYGLLLVDFALRNNVFNYTQPIYVDFHGIVTDELFNDIGNKKKSDNGNFQNIDKSSQEIIDSFLFVRPPNFLALSSISVIKAFIHLAHRQYESARKMLMIPHVNSHIATEKVNDNWGLLKELNSKKTSTQIYESLLKLMKPILIIHDFSKNQHLLNYYKNKYESFDFDDRTNWRPKQNSIYEILNKYKPTTVVDIGCNTGWFSILAEHLGAKVISIDADEACVDNLYLYSKEHKLNILPLKINFEDLDKKYFCKPIKKEFYSAPILRLKSELTLCLALVHHLVLAYGMSIEKVMNILARITNKVLVVEIPNLQDPLIRENLPYYRYAEDATSDRYSVDRFIEEGWKYFKKIEIYQSHPRTRKIIVFEK